MSVKFNVRAWVFSGSRRLQFTMDEETAMNRRQRDFEMDEGREPV